MVVLMTQGRRRKKRLCWYTILGSLNGSSVVVMVDISDQRSGVVTKRVNTTITKVITVEVTQRDTFFGIIIIYNFAFIRVLIFVPRSFYFFLINFRPLRTNQNSDSVHNYSYRVLKVFLLV